MTALTHAVFDATTGEQVSDPYQNAASALAAASALGGPTRGYVVDIVKWKPPPSAPNPAAESPPKPEAPTAAVAKDPEGPGLFD